MSNYKFINTKRFSPVIYENDLPWEEDYFHIDPKLITKDFLKNSEFLTDVDWWNKQRDRCLNGYTVDNAFGPGGDHYCTDVKQYMDEKTSEVIYYGGNIIDEGNGVIYLKDCDITIVNGKVKISGRMYFYLNFWKIKRVNDERTRKDVLNPKFTDLGFENWWIRERMRNEQLDNLWAKSRQKGLEQPHSEIILSDKGWITMGDIKIGDKVITPKNKISMVTNKFYQGKKDVYEIELLDGRKVKCGENHLWKVYDKRINYKRVDNNSLRIYSTKELIEKGITYRVNINKTNNIGYRFALPEIEAISFEEKKLPINPYLLGLLLGDGTINNALKIATADKEIIEIISSILGIRYNLKRDIHSYNYNITYDNVFDKEQHRIYNKCENLKINPLKEELKLLNLRVTCSDKFIPEIYIHSSIEQRLELIRGLMDTDGHISPDGDVEFKNCSKSLVKGIVYILRSLGIHVKVTEFKSPKGYKNFFRVYIKTTKYNLFKLSRKANRFLPNKKIFNNYPIKSITKLDYQEESSCILIDDEEHLYLTRDFIPTHNSEEEAADTAYEYLFFKNSQSAIVGGEDFYNENTMKFVKRGLDLLKNTQFYKDFKRGGESIDYLCSLNTGSEIYSRTCKDNEQSISGLSPSKVHLEEIGIFKKGLVTKVAETIDSSTKAEGIRTGFKVYTGTGGSMEEGVADMEQMLYHPDKNNLLQFENRYEDCDAGMKIARFIPATMFRLIDSDGNSRILDSIKDWYSEYYSKSEDKKYTFVVMNPLKPEQIFRIKDGGFFGKQISHWCNERKAYINNHREAQVCKRYRAILKNPSNLFAGVEMVPDPEGSFYISEMPEKDKNGLVLGNLYRAGTDSYDQDEAAFSTSKGACLIKKGFHNANITYKKYVGMVFERPTESQGGREVFYKNSAILCIFFNAINLIEYSKILIIDWYQKNGLTSLLKLRPEFVTAATVINSKAMNKYGIDPSTKSNWLTMQRTYLELKENIDKCDFLELLDAWARFRYDPSGKKYNCDLTIASSLCTVCEEDENTLQVYSESEVEKFTPIRYTKDKYGNIIQN